MANNYCLSSTFYPLKPEHFERAHEIIKEVGIENEARDYGYEKGTEDYESVEGWVEFQYEEQKDGFWFYHDESVNPDQMAEVFSRFQVEFNADKPFVFSYCFECSKPRIDEFGGGSLAIMPNGEIYHAGSFNDALKKAEEARQFARAVWVADDIQTLKPDWTTEEAEEWLHDHKTIIQERMIEAGWDAINCLI